MKTCYGCKIPKSSEEFSPSQFNLKYGKCRFCVRADSKKYRNVEKSREYASKYHQENKERESEYSKYYQKEYQIRNKIKKTEYNKQYRIDNKEKLLNNGNKYIKLRLKNDTNFRIRRYISSSIWRLLNGIGSSKKGKSIIEYLPYSIKELKSHIESLFEPWMTWENQGSYTAKEWDDNDPDTWKWQLDHIIPQSSLPYSSMDDENFKKSWDLSNLRPLSAKQNQLDGVTKIRHIVGRK